MTFSTSPGVLIAVPQLHDQNFVRSVVLMVEHTKDGAVGLVLNHVLDHTCAAVTEELDIEWSGAAHATLSRGGPVEPQSLWIVHHDGCSFAETRRVSEGLSVSRSREALTRMCACREPRLLLLVGYAGWGPGQLEREILQGSWLTSSVHPELVFDWPRGEIWHRALLAMGVDPAHLVEGASEIQ